MESYYKDKRIENAVVEVVEDNAVLYKQVMNFLLESISEVIDEPVNRLCSE